MNGVSRFDCYPSDFLNGVIGLTGDEIAAYTIVIMLQYDRGAPVAYVGREREISVRCGLTRGRLSKAVDRLLEIDKLSLSGGCLFNDRTARELIKISERLNKNAENSHAGGIATKDKWDKIRNNINVDSGPSGQPSGMPKQGPLPSPSLPPPPIKEICPISKKSDGALDLKKEIEREFSETFYPAYPLKQARPNAARAFVKARRKASLVEIMEGLERYKRTKNPDYAWAQPASWLNADRWADEPVGPMNGASKMNGSAPGVFVKIDTPQWQAWWEYSMRTKGKSPPSDSNGGWRFPSEYPPSESVQ